MAAVSSWSRSQQSLVAPRARPGVLWPRQQQQQAPLLLLARCFCCCHRTAEHCIGLSWLKTMARPGEHGAAFLLGNRLYTRRYLLLVANVAASTAVSRPGHLLIDWHRAVGWTPTETASESYKTLLLIRRLFRWLVHVTRGWCYMRSSLEKRGLPQLFNGCLFI